MDLFVDRYSLTVSAPLSGQYAEAKGDLQLATEFLKNTYASDLHGYAGDNVHYILDLLRPPRLDAISTSGLRSPPEVVYDDVIVPTVGPAETERRGPWWRRRRSKRPLAAAAGDFENGRPEAEVDIVVLDSAPPPPPPEVDVTYRSVWNGTASAAAADEAKYSERYTYVTRLLKIAHGLHYIGIVILGIFVVQVPPARRVCNKSFPVVGFHPFVADSFIRLLAL